MDGADGSGGYFGWGSDDSEDEESRRDGAESRARRNGVESRDAEIIDSEIPEDFLYRRLEAEANVDDRGVHIPVNKLPNGNYVLQKNNGVVPVWKTDAWQDKYLKQSHAVFLAQK